MPQRAVIALIVLIIAVVAIVFVVNSCNAEVDDTTQTYVSPYDWSNLNHSKGRYTYVEDGTVLSRFGIDVSENQGVIDWNAVADDGVEFAIIRVGYRGITEGLIYEDEYVQENLAGARAAGIDIGVYFFSQAISEEEAIEEADFVLSELDGMSLEYPVVFDSEASISNYGTSRTADLSQDQMTAIANAFCDRIEQAGYTAMIYGNTDDLSRYHLNQLDADVWYAEYGMPQPTVQTDFVMWQYASDGVIDGIDTAVDLDIDLIEAYKKGKGET